MIIIGMGWLGKEIAHQAQTQGWNVGGSMRRPDLHPIQENNVRVFRFDANHELAENHLPEADCWLIALPPSSAVIITYYKLIEALCHAAIQKQVKQICFTSSTSVYDEKSGNYDEQSATSESARAQILLDAEQLVLQSQRNPLIVRLGGLIGADRNPSLFAKNSHLFGNEPVNMIHQKDAAAAILHLIKAQQIGIFNAVAPEHPLRSDFYTASFSQNGQEAPHLVHGIHPVKRTIDSRKLTETGFIFEYPNPCNFPMKA